MKDDNTISTLNGLIETCRDGEYGFRQAADKVDSTSLKSTFEQHAQECATAARQLQEEVVRCGGAPDDGGSASGALHRGWVKARSALSSDDDLAMLEECERGEDAALERYRAALEEQLPGPVRQLVEQQYQGVKRNHAQVRQLRDQARAAR